MKSSLLYCFWIFTIIKLSDAAKEVQGVHEVMVQKGDKVKLTWTFSFSMAEVFTISINHYRQDGTMNGQSLIGVRQRQLLDGKNPQFLNRIVGSLPTNPVGISLEISDLSILDQGRYECRVDMNQFGVVHKNSTQVIVKVPPTIDKNFQSLDKTEREFASLKCRTTAGNPKPMKFTWSKEITEGKDVGKFAELISVEAWDRYDYNISSVGRVNVGQYRCEVENLGGRDVHNIFLRVRYTPEVIHPPINKTVFQDRGTESFNCGADGNPPKLKYHWYIGQATGANEIKQNTDVLKIENDGTRLKFVKPSRNDAQYYFCAASNELGTGKALGAFLNVTYVPGAIFIPNSINNVFNGNEGTNFSVKCESDANPPAAYTWSRRIVDWKGDFVYNPIVTNDYSGQLNFYNATTNDTGKYRCIAQNTPDRINPLQQYSATKEIDVIIRFGPRYTNLTINNTIYDVLEIGQGEMAEIRCDAYSEPKADYEIQLDSNGAVQLNGDKKVGYYKIGKMSASDEGVYKCIASNPILRTEEIREVRVRLAIRPTVYSPIPNNKETAEGATVSMKCYGKGRPAPKVYWQKYGVNITEDGVISMIYDDEVFVEALKTRVSAELKWTEIRHTDTGGYSCILYNSAGSVNTTATYTVLYPPKITQRPQNFSVRADQPREVKFVCDAVGYPDNVQWRWYFNDKATSVTTNVFVRAIPKPEDNGKYTCVSKNERGDGENATAYLHVEYKPIITFISSDVAVNVSANVKFTCKARGVPPPKITWTNVLDNKFSSVGEDLILTQVNSKHKGTYSCTASNVIGFDTKTVKLFVRHEPDIITTSPAETKFGANIGDKAILNCGVSSYPAAAITWNVQGSNVILKDGFDGYRIEESSNEFSSSSKLSVTVTDQILGREYLCNARNSFGVQSQSFQVLAKGKPEAPVELTITDVLVPTVPVTVNITLSWIPGFDGGYPVDFIILYRTESELSFSEYHIGQVVNNEFILSKMKANEKYVFSMKAKNERGISSAMRYSSFTSKDAPADVAEVSISRIGTKGTDILVRWKITREPEQTRTRRAVGPNVVVKWDYGIIRYRKVDIETIWTEERLRNIQANGTYSVYDLDGSQEYEFQFVLYDTSGKFGNPVLVGRIFPGQNPTVSERSGLSKTDIIALVVGCGGAVLLIIVIILFIIIHRKKDNKKAKYKTHYNNGRVQVDIPVSTMQSNYSNDVVRQSYLNDDDPFAAESSILDDGDKSPPPDYNSLHYNAPPSDHNERDYGDHPPQVSTFRPDDQATPSYTSFGRLPKKTSQDNSQSKSMTSLNGGQRATEISRRNDYRHSMDALDDYPDRRQREVEPLLNGDNTRNPRQSRNRVVSDDEVPEPPFPLRSPPSDDNNINNRVPGAFDRGKFKKPSPKPHEEPPSQPAPPPTGFHQNTGRHSPQSSVASSKPYRSDNEYIDDADDNYVGYLV